METTSTAAPTAPGWLEELAAAALRGDPPTEAQALAVLGSPDEQLLDVVAAAARLRRAHFGNRVKLNYLVNMKSGLCGEDCSYCSQRRGSQAGALTYNWLGPEQAAAEAERAARRGARRVCLVASGRGPSERDVERVAGTIAAIKERRPEMEVCVCLGLLGEAQAHRLKEAGAFAYNHNLNTAGSFYGEICTTHTFEDRQGTVRTAAAAGLSPCSGVIVGMGETDEQLVEAAVSLHRLGPDSVPVNFLMPFEGTPLAGTSLLTPARCLRVLAMFRFFFPATEVRIAGGREMHLRSLQPLGLHIANSIFLGDYLTSEGAPGPADLQMIADAGFVVEGAPEAAEAAAAPGEPRPTPGEPSPAAGEPAPGREGRGPVPGEARVGPPVLRRRGPGTTIPGNV